MSRRNGKFKIDFIVWKLRKSRLLSQRVGQFKIDFIVWKQTGMMANSVDISRV